MIQHHSQVESRCGGAETVQCLPNMAVLSVDRNSKATAIMRTVVIAVTKRPSSSNCVSEVAGQRGRTKSTTTTLPIALRLESSEDIAAARAPEMTTPAIPVGNSSAMKCGKTSSAGSDCTVASWMHVACKVDQSLNHNCSSIRCVRACAKQWQRDRVCVAYKRFLWQSLACEAVCSVAPYCGGRSCIMPRPLD